MEPHKPTNISKFAQACLDALSAGGRGRALSIGGAFGLAHYHEYRTTHDIDAWWQDNISGNERKAVSDVIAGALEVFGKVDIRSWGDVVSIELKEGGKKVFSFQIAGRSALLEPPLASPWPGIALDSLTDLLASKMTALVERGAPRDFRDIYTLCQSRMTDIGTCWKLWAKRQTAAAANPDIVRAKLAIETHLGRIATQRPLDQIADEKERREAEALRNWFTKDFPNG